MSSDTIDRKRHVDVEKVDAEQVDIMIEQISKRIIGMVDDTIEKANEMLNIYGLEAKMQVVILAKNKAE